MDSDIAQAVASMTQYGRTPMGTDPLGALIDDTPFAPSSNTRLVQKHQMKLSDPAIVPGAQPRTPMMAERLGAHYSVQADVTHPNPLPEASATMSSARIVPPRINRSMDSFQGGASQP